MRQTMKQSAILTGLVGLLISACEYTMTDQKLPDSISGADGQSAQIGGPVDGQAVCNPLNEGGIQLFDHGLKGKLYSGPAQTLELDKYFKPNYEAPVDIYMNKVNVPTRAFDRGFITLNGSKVINGKGETLYEWFALKLESQLKLAPNDSEGLYQIALIADDGARLSFINSSGVFEPLISHPTHTSSKFMCATKVVDLNRFTRLPMELKYFQGPRHHIALMMMWRKITTNSANALKDSLCGQAGNDLFFDSSKDPSTPQAAYNQLLARGWKPLQEENFLLPLEAQRNPCPQQTNPAPTPTPQPPVGEGPGTTPSPSPSPTPTPELPPPRVFD